jgi:hypothetical protein
MNIFHFIDDKFLLKSFETIFSNIILLKLIILEKLLNKNSRFLSKENSKVV